jgi:hypothetical protein
MGGELGMVLENRANLLDPVAGLSASQMTF